MAALIEITGLTKRFGTFTAVDGISFHVERGEVLGFLGPNGAGKSTTMRMLAGFITPTDGSARICGFDVQKQGVAARRHLGYLPEGAPTYPDMAVGDFLRFCGRIRGFRGSELTDRVNHALHLTALLPDVSLAPPCSPAAPRHPAPPPESCWLPPSVPPASSCSTCPTMRWATRAGARCSRLPRGRPRGWARSGWQGA